MIKEPSIYVFEAISGNPNKIGWVYVGQTRGKYGKANHLSKLRNGKHHSRKFQRYFNKYGEKSFVFKEIFKCPKNELNFWEKFWIKCFDSYRNGFNETVGGQGNSVKSKSGVLENILTGEVVEFESAVEFGEKYGISNARITPVINGKINRVGNWFCPLNKWRPKIRELISPDGQLIRFFSIKDFAEKYNLGRDEISNLLRGVWEQYRGWTRPNSKFKNKNDSCIKSFKVVSPTGEVFHGSNIRQFAKGHGLEPSLLTFVINGKRRIHKGWTAFDSTIRKPNKPREKYDIKLQHPNGEKIDFHGSFAELARKLVAARSNVRALYVGNLKSYKGWTKA